MGNRTSRPTGRSGAGLDWTERRWQRNPDPLSTANIWGSCISGYKREEVIGKFNGHLQDCVLFIADEAYWGGDKRCVGRLQGMITEVTLPIERKGIDLIQVPHYLHVVMLAEPGWVIPAGRYERRYAALAVNDARRGDKSYFRALHRQIIEGGAEAMFHDLREMELGDWHPRDIPEALLCGAALQKQQGF